MGWNFLFRGMTTGYWLAMITVYRRPLATTTGNDRTMTLYNDRLLPAGMTTGSSQGGDANLSPSACFPSACSPYGGAPVKR
uniref:Uncharacterized protein n=2 Tax=Picea TaxID=3328 RepID=A0A101LTY9_PICGL|nr:hypothetical protein ABT39_MTgene3470 [Picea glauca]QHR89688.1 hypothetical protein Q903MT_gene3710 [Picea sitchensis]